MFISMIAALSLTGCANDILNQGSAVSNTSKDTQQNHVKLYYGNSGLPKHYKVVGRVSAENYNLFAMENSQADIAQELKNQAASIGANGVMNISTGLAQTTGDAIVRK
ncbi:MAG: hypothetical protein JO149_06935 [Gammaproteobacteria bacterium]|nr:hypothetical protein [Gammaproteobacteria bacterium]